MSGFVRKIARMRGKGILREIPVGDFCRLLRAKTPGKHSVRERHDNIGGLLLELDR